MKEVVTVESNERLVETDQVLDTLVVVELEQLDRVQVELQELLATELELIETQRNLPEVLEVLGERVVLEVAQQGPGGPPGAEGPPGPPGPQGPIGPEGDAPPIEPEFTYSGGKLVAVAYADGSTKTLAYTGDRLTSLDFLRTGYGGVRKNFSYNGDGTLAAVSQSAI